jgi:putative flippase GtrA
MLRRTPFLRFLLVGGIAAAVNVGCRAMISPFVPFEVAVLLAFPVALTVAYFLNRRFVFERSGNSVRQEYARFAAVNLLALLQVWIVSVTLSEWLFPLVGFVWHPELVAHVVGVLSPVATSYYTHRAFTFSASRKQL